MYRCGSCGTQPVSRVVVRCASERRGKRSGSECARGKSDLARGGGRTCVLHDCREEGEPWTSIRSASPERAASHRRPPLRRGQRLFRVTVAETGRREGDIQTREGRRLKVGSHEGDQGCGALDASRRSLFDRSHGEDVVFRIATELVLEGEMFVDGILKHRPEPMEVLFRQRAHARPRPSRFAWRGRWIRQRP